MQTLVKNSLIALSLVLLAPAASYAQGLVPRTASAKQLNYQLPSGAAAIFSKSYLTTRYRFIENFLFDGAVAAERIPGQKTLTFSDQTIDMGLALLTFAAESKVLADHNLSTEHTDLLIRHLLQEFEKLDLGPYESQIFGGESQPGFFLRDGVELNNRHGVPTDWSIVGDLNSSLHVPETPSYQAAMSNDQVIHMLLGWWAVTNWSRDDVSTNLAKVQAARVMDYILWTEFQLKLPNGDSIPTHRGSDMRLSSVSVARMADAITQNNYFGRGKVEFEIGSLPVRIKVEQLYAAMKPIDGFAKDALTKDQVSIKLPGIGSVYSFDVKSYSKNLMLLGLAFEPSFDDQEYVDLAFETGHYLGGLLRLAKAQKEAKVQLNQEQIAAAFQAFSTYPKDGPSNSPEKGLWSTPYRWSRVAKLDGDGTSYFNGLDYMGFEALMVATHLLEKGDIREQNRQNLVEFSRKTFGTDMSPEAINQALDALETQSWTTVKENLINQKTTELYRLVWGENFVPTAQQLEEGRTYPGHFEELKVLIKDRYTAIIATVIATSIILN